MPRLYTASIAPATETLRTATEYLDEAATGVRENKERYDRAETAAQQKPPSRRRYFFPTPDIDDD